MYPRGSEWRQWDLHIHTPMSVVQEYGGDTPASWEAFIVALENLPPSVKVLGINDYYFVEGIERVYEFKYKHGRLQNIDKLFPVIEFRCDSFGSASGTKLSKLNVHVLFEIDDTQYKKELNTIREEFVQLLPISALPKYETKPLTRANMIACSPDNSLKSGFDSLIPSTTRLFNLLDSDAWAARTIALLGYIEWNDLDKDNQAKLIKADLARRVDAFLTASPSDNIAKKQKVLKLFGGKALLHASDSHDLKHLTDEYRCFSWVKANPTFRGLQVSLHEHARRIAVTLEPEELKNKRLQTKHLISDVKFETTSPCSEWFDSTDAIPINDGLVAIIGHKGSGKSALVDFVAWGSGVARTAMTFLVPERFLKSSAARRTLVKTRFKDSSEVVGNASDRAITISPPRVQYLSQQHMNDLCSEVDGASQIQDELDRVLYASIAPENRFDEKSLKGIIERLAGSFSEKLEQLTSSMAGVNRDIVEIEEASAANAMEALTKERDDRVTDFQHTWVSERPAWVAKPTSNQQKELEATRKRLRQIEANVNVELASHQQALTQLRKAVASIGALVGAVTRLREELSEQIAAAAPDLAPYIDSQDIAVALKIEFADEKFAALKTKLQSEDSKRVARVESIKRRLKRAKAFVDGATTQMSLADKTHTAMLAEQDAWRKKVRKMIGDKSKPVRQSIRGAENEIQYVQHRVKNELPKALAQRQAIAARILECMASREASLAAIYAPLQEVITAIATEIGVKPSEMMTVTSKYRLRPEFHEEFLRKVDMRASGTFQGKHDGAHALQRICDTTIGDEVGSFLELANQLVAALQHDLVRDPTGVNPRFATDIARMLRCTLEEFYNWLYSFQYVEAKFSLQLGGKFLETLSPGEKGMAVLMFYLLLDKEQMPLLIDQPEENLDNETIFHKLVKFLNFARTRRQVIIVTHNPNLAVACDADQVVVAAMNKENGANAVTYRAGGLETSHIEKACIDILEGTPPAFGNRAQKYHVLGRTRG